jgi:hypothetical protein
MNGAIGYFGAVEMDPDFTHNPLQSVPPNKIQLTRSEVMAALQNFHLPAWNQLNPSQAKMVVTWILQQRGDVISRAQASQVIGSNSAFQHFEILNG